MKIHFFSGERKVMHLRVLIQIICFLVLPSLFIELFYSIKSIMVFVIHGQGNFELLVPELILLVCITIITIADGRFFCGWMCSFGALGDLIYALAEKVRKRKIKPKRTDIQEKADYYFKFLKYLILAVIIIFMWGFQILSIPAGCNPWEVFGILSAITKWPSSFAVLKGFVPAVIIFVGILIASAFVERFFCRYLCPLGAYLALVSKWRCLYIHKDKSVCGNCTLCSRKCKVGINLENVESVRSGECIQCLSCIECCPKDNSHIMWKEKRALKNKVVIYVCCFIGISAMLCNFAGSATRMINGHVADKSSGVLDQSQMKRLGDYKDGTYTGKGNGFRGTITVEVTVENGYISAIEILSSQDDKAYLNQASAKVIPDILEKQGTEVDAVSGATYSSNGIMEAVADALGVEYTATETEVPKHDGHGGGKGKGQGSGKGRR